MKDHSIVVFGPLQDFARPQTDLEGSTTSNKCIWVDGQGPVLQMSPPGLLHLRDSKQERIMPSSFLRKPLQIQRKNKIRNKLEQVE